MPEASLHVATPALTGADATALLDHTVDGFWILDRGLRFVYANRCSEALMGRDARELAGRAIWDAFPDMLGTRLEAGVREACESGAVGSFEQHVAERWFDIRLYPLPSGLAIRMRDISAHKQAAERMALALDTTGLGLWDHDILTGGLVWDERTRALFGLAPDAALGGLEQYRALLHPSDRARVIEAYLEALDPGASGQYATEHRTAGPPERWLLNRAQVLFDAARRPVRVIGTVLDITERRRAEELVRTSNQMLEARVAERTRALEVSNQLLHAERARLGAVLEQLPVGVLVAAASGEIVIQNAAARALVGRDLTGAAAIGGQGAGTLDAATAALAGPDTSPLGLALRHGVVTARRLQPWDAAGRQAVLELSAAPVRDEQGQTVLGVLAVEDVTARLQAETALRRSQRQEAIGQLTGGIAHEFNNLLTAVLGSLHLLAGQAPSERAARLIEAAIRAADRGAGLTTQLLAFSRKQQLRPQPVDLASLLGQMVPLLASTLGGTVAVETAFDPDTWPAMADQAQVELLALNLAINARDAMPLGGRLTISTRNVARGDPVAAEDPPAGAFVALCIADTGAGMAADVLARAFEPFFTTKDVGRGSGLGLSQVLGTAQQLGGGVAIDSVPGQGTRVTVFLPRSAVAARAPASGGRETAPANALDGLRLLLVDDDAEVRETMAALLLHLGAHVTDVATGEQAIAALDAGGAFDAALLDYAMPVMTGAEAAGRIRAAWPGLGIVLVTGYAGSHAPLAGVLADAVLHKPFRAHDLVGAVRRALAAAHRTGQL